MSDKSRESREDALERILAETAKNPYTPKKPVRPALRPNTPQNSSKTAVANKRPAASGNRETEIPVTRVLTEAQKAEAAKNRAAKRVEEIKRARQQREALEKQKLEDVARYFEMPQKSTEKPKKTDAVKETPPQPEKTPEKSVQKKSRKKKKNDDTGLWDSASDEEYSARIARKPRTQTDQESNSSTDVNTLSVEDILDIVQSALAVIIAVTLLYSYIIRIAVVDGTSMNPTLDDNDRLIVKSIGYSPQNGDVVAISNESAHLLSEDGKVVESQGLEMTIVKRVIAMGGQTIDIDFENGDITVDGKLLEEKYISEPTARDEHAFTYPLEVPTGYVFVMGDNRNVSMDSRHPDIGLVPEKNIMGEVVLRIYPFDKFGGID